MCPRFHSRRNWCWEKYPSRVTMHFEGKKWGRDDWKGCTMRLFGGWCRNVTYYSQYSPCDRETGTMRRVACHQSKSANQAREKREGKDGDHEWVFFVVAIKRQYYVVRCEGRVPELLPEAVDEGLFPLSVHWVFYRWISLPLGWGRSSYWFVKLLRPLVRYFREKLRYIVLPYIDEFLLAVSRAGRLVQSGTT